MDVYISVGSILLTLLELITKEVQGQDCGSTLSSTTGVIQSPGYPRNYPNSLNCSWRIEASLNMIIELHIETFDLKYSASCSSDSLAVYDGIESASTVMLLGPSCGSSIPWPAHPTTLLSSGSIMTLVFKTDSSFSSSGFRATYTQVEPRKETFIVAEAVGGKIYQQNRFGVDSKEIPFFGLSRPVAIDYDPVDDKVYIADAGRNVIVRGNLDGSEQEIIISSFVTEPRGIAVDSVSRVVYWTDEVSGLSPVLFVARLDGSFRKILVKTNIISPGDVVVQPNLGYVYWSDRGEIATDLPFWPLQRLWGKIERMNGDGSDRTVLINSNLICANAIAIDMAGGKLYWTDTVLRKIERSNLDGSLRELVKQFDDHVSPVGLIFRDNALFWISRSSPGINVGDSEFDTDTSQLLEAGVSKCFRDLAFHSTADPAVEVNDCSLQGNTDHCRELCLSRPFGFSCVSASPIFRNCPNNIFITTKGLPLVKWTKPTAFSPSGVPVNVTSSHPESSLVFTPNDGTIEVTYSAVDIFGHFANNCVFHIFYVEEDPPVIYDCPKDILRECSSLDDVIYVSWTPPRAVDDLEDVTLSFQSHHLHGDTFSVGNTSVTYVWEDRAGNSAECSFLVFISVRVNETTDSYLDEMVNNPLGVVTGSIIFCIIIILVVIGLSLYKFKRRGNFPIPPLPSVAKSHRTPPADPKSRRHIWSISTQLYEPTNFSRYDTVARDSYYDDIEKPSHYSRSIRATNHSATYVNVLYENHR